MDLERRARLEEKRRLAQLRRRRSEISATFRGLAIPLRRLGVPVSKLMPHRCREALGPLASGPGRDERLLWAPIPGGRCERWASPPHRDSLLRAALDRCARPDEAVAVIWHPFEAGLRIAAADLAAHAPVVLEALHGTVWIVAAAGGPWLIEIAYWDGELCAATSMPLFAGAG